ncbi:MAG: metalloregulator ArsR/SmtB family transcription factor [Alphaproteobacteria bacterium]
MLGTLSSNEMVELLKAAGESTRLRLLVLLAHDEYNVKDLTQILGQSQPRLSRHLKLLSDIGLIERFHEGSSVFLRLAENTKSADLIAQILQALDHQDPVIAHDAIRADAVRREKSGAAQRYFEEHAARWNEIRALHAPQAKVEAAMLDAMGEGPFDLLVDVATGTGRILEMFCARVQRSIGFDINREMLAHARARLAASNAYGAQVRLGDLFNLPLENSVADAVVLHQVLHFLDEPARAISEAARILKPDGRLLIVDFAAHNIETLREHYKHRRLGFERGTVEEWLEKQSLSPTHYEAISPGESNSEKLTVSLWLATKTTKK